VPIADVDVRFSPGWWMRRLFRMLGHRDRQTRLRLLRDYHRGHAPLPEGAENAREAYAAFQRQARSNFAELVVSAVSERMTPVGFRTRLDDDATGDAQVGALWRRAGLDVQSADVHDKMLALSECYVIVGEADDELGAPLISCEDPLLMVGDPDPAYPRRLRAALKVLHDDAEREDRAYLYLPGRSTESGMAEIHVAVRQSRYDDYFSGPTDAIAGYRLYEVSPSPLVFGFNPQSWSWDEQRSGQLTHPAIPVVRFCNKDDLGEYEAHTDLLRRINHQILQRMVITVLQAFRQRAVRGLPLKDPRTGEEIDYSGVFTMDPAALWQLPETAQMWESGQVDLTPILSAVKDDVQHLAAVTRTPMHMLMPSGVNQSAEGASMQREGLVFKTRDRIERTSTPWAQVMSLALLQMGDDARADLAGLDTIWAPPEHLSMAERADAASKAGGDIPRRSRLIHIWGFSPDEADRMMTEWADDQLLAAQVAAATASPATTATATAAGGPGPAQAPNTTTAAPGALAPPAPAQTVVAQVPAGLSTGG
jgi:hypothetical protein